MKTLGIIGGLGPETTIYYYKNVIAMYRELQRDCSYPLCVINSVDLKSVLDFMYADKLDEIEVFLLAEIEKLLRAGADFGVIAANTPHIVFDQIRAKSSLPLISIVEATCVHAKARGLNRLALFGTKFTMQADFYQKMFALESIDVVVPESSEQDYIHQKYFAELVFGEFLPETRAGLLAIVDRIKAKRDIDGVILAGTEIPLILRCENHNGVTLLDTGKIHCLAAVNEIFS
jgi:aspartate racemase